MYEATAVERPRIVGSKSQRLVTIRKRRLELSCDGSSPTAIIPCVGSVGIELNDPAIVCYGAIELLGALIGPGPAEYCRDEAGVQLDRLLVRFDRLSEFQE